MEIIGIPHKERYLGQIERYLQENYPEGIKSLLVELPPIPPELESIKADYPGYIFQMDDFFSPIANKYENKGTNIIYGDINRKLTDKRKGILGFADNLKEIFGKDRDRGIEKMFRQELPEVTILGTNHAKRLKKAFPDVPFTHFYTKGNSSGERFGNYIVNTAKKYANKTIPLD